MQLSPMDQAGVYDWWHNLESQPEEGYTTHLITSHALNFIEENQEHPFSSIWRMAPHYPIRHLMIRQTAFLMLIFRSWKPQGCQECL